jgi:hypothetical protein
VQLVDTPGFNDTNRSDMDILVTITEWIHVNKVAVAGIIYLYKITDMRFTGASRMNLEILKALCGEQFYPHLVLSSTMWDEMRDESGVMQAKERERELLQSPHIWKDILAKGAEYKRYSGSQEQGHCMVDHLLSRQNAPSMAITIELRDQSVDNTTVGQLITEEGRKREEKLRQELLEEEEEEERLLKRELELEQSGTGRRRAGLGLIRNENGGDTGIASRRGIQPDRDTVPTVAKVQAWQAIFLSLKSISKLKELI